MDGILGDRIANGRLLRPATLTYALDNFPRLIYRLKQAKLKILSTTVISGKRFYRIRDSVDKHKTWVILEADYNLCRDIATSIELKIFPSDTSEIIERNIRALIKVSFSSRPF